MHKVLGAPTSTLAESDPVRHKQRKAPLEPLFAKKNMHALEPMLMEHVDHCCRRFDEFYEAGKPVSMEWALKSLAMGEYPVEPQVAQLTLGPRHGLAVCLWQVLGRPE